MARVLFLDQFATLGGGQRILVDVAEGFASAGHEVLVAIPPATASERAEVAAELDLRSIRHVDVNLPSMGSGSKGVRDVLSLAAGTVALRGQVKRLAIEFGA